MPIWSHLSFLWALSLYPEGPPSAIELASGAQCHLHCSAAQPCELGPAFLGLYVFSSPLKKLDSQ